jgi:hypothetical protein
MGYLTNIQFSDDRIEFEDTGTTRITESYDLAPKVVKNAVLQDSQMRSLQANVMGADINNNSISSDIYNKKTAYLLYDWVAVHIRERSLVLGLKSEYTVAQILLRTAVEARMTGIFINSLADTEFREAFRNELDSMNTDILQRQFSGSNPWEVLKKIEDTNLESTAGVLDIINETGNQDLHDIHNGFIRNLLDEFQYFDPKSIYDIKQCYSSLSSSVHAHIEESLVRRSIIEHSNPFESPSHSEEGLRNFLSQYHSVLDIEGVLILNEYESVIKQNEEIRELMKTTEYQLPDLNDTKSKLNTLLAN